ncbi:hypothetical protein FRB96_000176 [Tulasnella sp. 330]|nr:hypothetical protein FRB96_000176 [Tulasnella sp. 330]KAG8885908.1 hypothetical protein FRB97_009070 [Tulasnella sp. 331]
MNGIKSEYEEGLPLDIQMNGRTEPLASIMPVETRKSVWVVHIEVRLKPTSSALVDLVRKHVKQHISSDETLLLPSIITGWEVQSLLYQNVELIRASESTCPHSSLPLDQAELEIHVYQPNDTDVFEEFSTTGKGDGDDMMAASVCDLPCRSWDGLWDTLIYPDDIKPRLLNYIYATLLFSDRDVNFNIITWNRVVFLHGPPGTGKTSLCRALAQKLSIRLSERYPTAKLVEINSHSLFSKWFSESGKLVQRLFASVTDMVEEEGTFVVLLIDEVESLTAARAGAVAGTEPSDALRVVNALLTQLDKLKHRKNVLVMTTSNLADAIDTAFIDRADIVQYVGLPPQEGIYWILQSCIAELIRAQIVSPVDLVDPKTLQFANNIKVEFGEEDQSRVASKRLWELAGQCIGMSGRSLRRLPVLAHARHIGASAMGGRASDISVWLDAMTKVVADERNGRLFNGKGGAGNSA